MAHGTNAPFIDLAPLVETWREVTTRKTEIYTKPLGPFGGSKWPPDYTQQLEITHSEVVNNPLKTIPLTAYILNYNSYRYVM